MSTATKFATRKFQHDASVRNHIERITVNAASHHRTPLFFDDSGRPVVGVVDSPSPVEVEPEKQGGKGKPSEWSWDTIFGNIREIHMIEEQLNEKLNENETKKGPTGWPTIKGKYLFRECQTRADWEACLKTSIPAIYVAIAPLSATRIRDMSTSQGLELAVSCFVNLPGIGSGQWRQKASAQVHMRMFELKGDRSRSAAVQAGFDRAGRKAEQKVRSRVGPWVAKRLKEMRFAQFVSTQATTQVFPAAISVGVMVAAGVMAALLSHALPFPHF